MNSLTAREIYENGKQKKIPSKKLKLEDYISEMSKELLPALSIKDDIKILKQLKRLYRLDKIEFNKKLEYINKIRKSEGLEPIYKEEVTGKSLKQNLKKVDKEEKIKNKKEKIIEKNFKWDLENFASNQLQKPFEGGRWELFKKESGVSDKEILEIKLNLQKKRIGSFDNWSSAKPIFINGKRVWIFIIPTGIKDVYNSPIKYKISSDRTNVIFPTENKKIDILKKDFYGMPKITKI
jgi:hypothetical protein